MGGSWHIVDGTSELGGQFSDGGASGNLVGRDNLSNDHSVVAFALVENLARKAQKPHSPIYEPQQIVKQRVAPLEVNGDDGHFGPLNEPYEPLLPLAVAYLATP